MLLDVLEPLVSKCISSRESLLGVNNQKVSDQIENLRTASFEFFVIKVIFGVLNLVKYFISVFTLEWKITTHEDVKENTE
jgi:hypothetical protein